MLYNKTGDSVPGTNLRTKCIEFVQVQNNIIIAVFDLCELNTGGKWPSLIAEFVGHIVKKDKYDNCTLRPEYYYAKLVSKGTLSNCFLLRHIDVNKEIYYPDDPSEHNTSIKKFLNQTQLIVPKTMIHSKHLFFAISVRDKLVEIDYLINPEFFGAPKTINSDENMSEYHRNNIENFPIKKKFIDEWLIKRIKFHKKFEKDMRAKKHQLINFEIFDEINIIESNESTISSQLKSINELYKSGVLTKEEFDKAKKKILN